MSTSINKMHDLILEAEEYASKMNEVREFHDVSPGAFMIALFVSLNAAKGSWPGLFGVLEKEFGLDSRTAVDILNAIENIENEVEECGN